VFVGGDAAHGPEPWVTDGTATGTFRLADLNPGPAGSVSAPSWLSTGRRAYFPADDGTHGLELWTTDGTSAGTRMVVDLRRGATGTQPRELVLSNGKVYFTADHPLFERELLVIDDPGATSKTVGVPSRSAWAHRFSAGNPVIGDRLVLHLRDSAPGAAIVVLFSSGVPRPIPFGAAGWLYVDPASFLVLAVGTTDARGSWSTSFPLDASLFLLQGLTTTMQALVGPSSAPLGFDLSNGAQATFGY
jgi:ELWxxDGT repeat protein